MLLASVALTLSGSAGAVSRRSHGETSVPSQAEEERNVQTLDGPSLESFNRIVDQDEDDLVFKVCWYSAPYRDAFFKLRVFSDGRAIQCHEMPDWATQATVVGTLSARELGDLHRALEVIKVRSYPKPTEIASGKVHTAIAFRENSNTVRLDFSGDVPEEVRKVLRMVRSAVKRSTRTHDVAQ